MDRIEVEKEMKDIHAIADRMDKAGEFKSPLDKTMWSARESKKRGIPLVCLVATCERSSSEIKRGRYITSSLDFVREENIHRNRKLSQK